MEIKDFWILGLHAFVYLIWFFDSRTVESWRNKRRFWKSAPAAAAGPRPHVKIHAEFHDNAVRRQQERLDAMRRHPAGSKNPGKLRNEQLSIDNQTIARIVREEIEAERRRRGSSYIQYSPYWEDLKKGWQDDK